jgi:tripartite-type tricarboxylate transporter receptor subunit TctC
MRSLKGFALVGLALIALQQGALSQDYPTRAITIIVPFAPGGAADIGARVFGEKLSARLGKPAVVENKAGAGTVIGATAAAKAVPDGYTLFMGGSSALALNPTLYKTLPYDSVKDFMPLAHIVGIPFILVVHPSLPVQSVPDLIKLAKEKPGQHSFATSGPGSPAHLYTELFKSMTGVEVTQIPYKGSAAALPDFLAGRVPVMFIEFPPSLPLIKEGKMRALGVSSMARVPAAPEIAPIAEKGVPGFDAAGWLMLTAPAGTPKDIVEKLHAELKAISASTDMQGRIARMGLVPIQTAPVADLQRFVKSEIDRWGKVLKQAGLAGSQ